MIATNIRIRIITGGRLKQATWLSRDSIIYYWLMTLNGYVVLIQLRYNKNIQILTYDAELTLLIQINITFIVIFHNNNIKTINWLDYKVFCIL